MSVRRTFEATPLWRAVLRRAFSLRERVVDLGDAEVILWKHPCYARWISTPYRDRVAVSWEGSEFRIDRPKLDKLFAVGRDVILKDCASYLADGGESSPSQHIRQQHTNCDVRLDADMEARMNRSARKNWRKATEDYGLEIRLNPSGCFEEFYRIYVETRHRLGAPPYSRTFFAELFSRMGDEVVLFQCSDGETVYGYLVCYVHDSEMISAHIGYQFEHREKRIADFLFMSAFRWGADRGLATYRYGADYNNQTSLIAAKRKLGAEPRVQIDLTKVQREPAVDDPDSLVRRTLRALPRPVFAATSALTQIYFQ